MTKQAWNSWPENPSQPHRIMTNCQVMHLDHNNKAAFHSKSIILWELRLRHHLAAHVNVACCSTQNRIRHYVFISSHKNGVKKAPLLHVSVTKLIAYDSRCVNSPVIELGFRWTGDKPALRTIDNETIYLQPVAPKHSTIDFLWRLEHSRVHGREIPGIKNV